MPIYRIELDSVAKTVRLWRAEDDPSPLISVASFPGNAETKRQQVEAALQAYLDNHQPIADLPDGDPDKLVDPARPDLFWDGTDLVGRGVKVTVEYDGTNLNLLLQRLTD